MWNVRAIMIMTRMSLRRRGWWTKGNQRHQSDYSSHVEIKKVLSACCDTNASVHWLASILFNELPEAFGRAGLRGWFF